MSPVEKQEVLKKVALLMEQMTRAETEGRKSVRPVQALRARPRASRSPATRSRSMSAAGSRTWNSTSSAINQYVRLSRTPRAATQQAAGVVDLIDLAGGGRDAGGHGRLWRMQHDARLRRIGAESQRARYVLAQVSPPGEGRGAKCAPVVAGPAMRSRRKMRQSSRAPGPRPPGTSAGWRAPRLAVPPCASWPGRAHPDNQTPPAIDRGRPSPAWPAAPRPTVGPCGSSGTTAARSASVRAQRAGMTCSSDQRAAGFLDAAHRAGGRRAQRDSHRQRFLVVQQQRRQEPCRGARHSRRRCRCWRGPGSPARAACRYPAAACADAPPASWPAPGRSSGCGFAAATAGAAGGGWR